MRSNQQSFSVFRSLTPNKIFRYVLTVVLMRPTIAVSHVVFATAVPHIDVGTRATHQRLPELLGCPILFAVRNQVKMLRNYFVGKYLRNDGRNRNS